MSERRRRKLLDQAARSRYEHFQERLGKLADKAAASANGGSTPETKSAPRNVFERCAISVGSAIGMIAICVCGFVGVVAGGSVAIALLLVPGALLAWALGLPIEFTLLFTFVAIALIVVWQRFAPSEAQRAETTREMLTARLCPACGHSLVGLDADDAGGPVTCPECGEGWTIPEPVIVRCDVCDASMEGQTVDRFGRLRCPSCGDVHVPRSVAMEQMD